MGSEPAAKPGRRNAALDGLRAVAALSVFGFHAWLYTLSDVRMLAAPATLGNEIFAELRVGLVLFFVLSGFLLYRPWVRSALEGSAAPSTVTYTVRRIGRIIPAYWLAIIGSALLLYPLAGSPGVRLPPVELLPLFFIFAQNFSPQTLLKLDPPMWTLAVEAAFYVVLPAVGWLALRGRGSRHWQLAVPALLLVLGIAFNYVLAQQAVGSPRWSKSLPAMLPYFAVGMLAAVAVNRRSVSSWASRLLIALGLLLVAADIAAHVEDIEALPIIRDLPGAVGFALIVGVSALRPPRLLELRPLVWVGTISYGLYLWHVPVLLVLRANGLVPLNPWGATLIALPISLLLGWLSLRFVETPAMAWSRRTKVLGANLSGSSRRSA
uniref:Unannotated protein n=1 Tax=freshwater metagenome TaxID=449393 RepID=A0A6J5ZDW8_9ZZZZ